MKNIFKTVKSALANTWHVVGTASRTLLHDPQITIYAWLGVVFIWITTPFVSRFIYHAWQNAQNPVMELGDKTHAPHVLLSHLGLVAFSAFYAAFVTAYFTCAISISTWAKLEGQRTTLLYGLRMVGRHFLRVTWFALLAVFFFPIGVWSQRRKLPKGIIGVTSSSFSLSTQQLAPAIMTKQEGVYDTVCHAVTTLGSAAHESLVIRIGSIVAYLLIGSLGFLPKLAQHYFFSGDTARLAGWFITVLLGLGAFVLAKVISTVLTTTLYYKVTHKQL